MDQQQQLIEINHRLSAALAEALECQRQIQRLIGGNLTKRLDLNPDGWPLLTPKELRSRIVMPANTLALRLGHPYCPPYYSERSPGGRLLRIQPNVKLVCWLRRPKGQLRPLTKKEIEDFEESGW